jgi:hypothetical protein
VAYFRSGENGALSGRCQQTGLDYFQTAAEGPYDKYYWRKA